MCLPLCYNSLYLFWPHTISKACSCNLVQNRRRHAFYGREFIIEFTWGFYLDICVWTLVYDPRKWCMSKFTCTKKQRRVKHYLYKDSYSSSNFELEHWDFWIFLGRENQLYYTLFLIKSFHFILTLLRDILNYHKIIFKFTDTRENVFQFCHKSDRFLGVDNSIFFFQVGETINKFFFF